MAFNLDLKNKENKQKIMILVLVGVLVATFFVLYFYFFQSQSVVPLSMEVVSEPLIAIQERQLNTEVLSDPVFQGLKKFGDYPVDVKDSELGRENPFIPF